MALHGRVGDVRGANELTVLPEDTFGISRILSDYTVETTFRKLGAASTKVEIRHYYSTTSLKAKLLNLIAKGKIAPDTQEAWFNELLNRRDGHALVQSDIVEIRIHPLSITITTPAMRTLFS
jgi:hypothetical protein